MLREFDLTPIFEQIDYEAEMRSEFLERELATMNKAMASLGISIPKEDCEEEWVFGSKEEGYEVKAKSDTDIAIKTLSSLGYSEEEIEEMLGIK
jgi:predicted nucleotidyltransferase